MENNFSDKTLNIDVTDYWMIIQKRFFQILLVFFLVILGTVAYSLKQDPLYQAECKIRISARQPMATIEGAQITWYGAGGNDLSSEIELISNKDQIMDTVADILKNRGESLSINSEDNKIYYADQMDKINGILDPKLTTMTEKDYIKSLTGASIKGLIQIETIPSSDIIVIRAQNRYKEVAKAIANVVAIAYRADFWRSKTQNALDTKKFIDDQVVQVKEDLNKIRPSLQKVSEENAALGDAEILKRQLTELKIELDKLKETYQENHPKVEKQRKLIASIEGQLSKLPKSKQAYDDQQAEWDLNQNLRKSLGEFALKANIDYQAKRDKSKDEIQIISFALSTAQLKPKNTMNIIVGCLFGIILGLIYAFVFEGLDTSIGKIEDVERITNLPVIAHIPLIGNKAVQSSFFKPLKIILKPLSNLIPFTKKEDPVDLDKKILFNYDPLSVVAEAYKTLRTNIQFAIGTGKRTGNAIAITSASPREGKTLTSTNLAIALAQMGKMTLLIEADMRRPKIADLFKIDSKQGLSDILIGTINVEGATRTTADYLMGNIEWEKLLGSQGIDNLHIITCGTIPPNPSELLLSAEFREMISDMRQKYDFIIIDTPPILPVSDASIIGTVVDGTVLIYQSDTTSRHLLLRAIQTLKKNQTKLIGIVINQLSFDVVMLKSGRYKYKDGYAYSKDEL
ncbi:MAG TPA: hypothetical protein DET40_08410 [Lentisphaeria bacterium]|nr:MAG: hypothetical protein A2X45_25925 [Lentisphaerae bacterium GWF2_50_93]HCE43556.1 hypothetical protein [Lentisphaeria bacterium]